MFDIRPMQPEEVPAVKALIYRVAHRVFEDPRVLDEAMAFYEAQGELEDVDNYQQVYLENGGTFLVMLDRGQIIGTGAIRPIDAVTCELKRVWFLFEYHGRGLGYRMTQELLAFARERGYRRIRLETDPDNQRQAYEFYKRLGFYEIPRYSDSEDDIAMEMIL